MDLKRASPNSELTLGSSPFKFSKADKTFTVLDFNLSAKAPENKDSDKRAASFIAFLSPEAASAVIKFLTAVPAWVTAVFCCLPKPLLVWAKAASIAIKTGLPDFNPAVISIGRPLSSVSNLGSDSFLIISFTSSPSASIICKIFWIPWYSLLRFTKSNPLRPSVFKFFKPLVKPETIPAVLSIKRLPITPGIKLPPASYPSLTKGLFGKSCSASPAKIVCEVPATPSTRPKGIGRFLAVSPTPVINFSMPARIFTFLGAAALAPTLLKFK